jgi:hypothetical protein
MPPPLQHDTPGACSPGAPEGNYIMYPTSGGTSMPNNNRFSQCSINLMRGVMDVKGSCFVGVLRAQRCGLVSLMPPPPPHRAPPPRSFSVLRKRL